MKIAFVTGGARRIGRGLVERFCNEGYSVYFTYRNSETEALALTSEMVARGFMVRCGKCELTDPAQISKQLLECTSQLGLPNVVVSNAGIFPGPMEIQDLEVSELTDVISQNTLPLHSISKAYHELVAQANAQGRIVAITSVGAFETWKNRTAYNVSKHALEGLAKSLARNLAPSISVNCVAPGAVVFTDDPSVGDASAGSVAKIPMQRYGVAEDVADAVMFFADCTSYITGQSIAVDGGYLLTR